MKARIIENPLSVLIAADDGRSMLLPLLESESLDFRKKDGWETDEEHILFLAQRLLLERSVEAMRQLAWITEKRLKGV